MLFQIIDGCKAFGVREIFQNLAFEVRGTEKVAVVGKNGVGKTTLLDIIAGLTDLDAGEINKDKGLRVGYLKQTVFRDGERSVWEELEACFASIHSLKQKLEALEGRMESECTEEVLEKYGRMQEEFEKLGGYEYQTEMKTVFTKFGFHPEELQKKIREFSGGEKTKLALVKLLLSKPDILLLDEPTNHLDMDTVEWLEGYISRYPKAVVLVSHDRMFLDRTAKTVYEIEQGAAVKYIGNYTDFMREKKSSIARQNQRYALQQKEIRHLEELIEHFRYKVNKAKFAQSKIKYLERMDVISQRKEDTRTIHVRFFARQKGAERCLTVRDLGVGYDSALFDISFTMQRNQRVAVIGKNGTGKSTLVKTLAGSIKPVRGTFKFGDRIDVGYFDQELALFAGKKTVIEEVWDSFPNLSQTEIRNTLAQLLFKGEDVFKELDVLSGGERVRLALVKLMLRHDNFLILDEPTNHLDIYGKEVLENALKEFDGSVLLVSHDRYFIAKLATAVLEIRDHKAVFYDMPYEDYAAKAGSKA